MYKRYWNYLPARRDFARRGYSRLDGKIDPFIFFPLCSLLFLVCIAREPVGIRTGSTDLGPLLLFFLLSREAARGGSPLRAIAPSFVLLVSVALSSFFLFSACPCFFSSRFYLSPLPSVPLCFLSRLSSSFISVSPIGILFLQLLLRPFTVHLCYVTDTFIQGVSLSVRWILPADFCDRFLRCDFYDARFEGNYLTLFFNFIYYASWRQNSFFLIQHKVFS